MKKALFIANGIVEDRPGVSGGEVRFIEIAKGWKKLGYSIHLLSNKRGKQTCNEFGLKVRLHKKDTIVIKTRLNFLFRTFSSLTLPASLRGFKGQIVYSTNEQLYDVFPGLALKLRNRDVKWGVVVHWLPPWKFWTRENSTFINSLLFLISERTSLYIACLFADRLLAVSESTKDQIQKDIFGRFFIKKVRVVECGVDLEYIKSTATKGMRKKYDAVFMKRIQAVKGIFDLVEIWEKVVAKKSTAKLLVIGSGPDEEEAKRRAKEKGLENNIEFFGPILDMDLKFQKIRESKLFLLPSYEENWAIVIGEALAAGVPVICYDLSELKQVWKKSVYYIKLNDTTSFAKKIILLLNDPKSRSSKKNRGLDYIKRYSWEEISKKELEHLLY